MPPIIQDLITLFFSIVVEAFPFVLLGVLVSVVVGVFVKEEWLYNILPKNRIIRHAVIALFGIFMPVCECGNVPVARRLVAKGFTVSEAVTFLLAAPILNPITFYSTLAAFQAEPSISYARMTVGFLIAFFVGLLISFQYKDKQEEVLTPEFIASCEHDHEHHDSKLHKALEIFQTEFMTITKMLIFGAAIAAISQAFIPREVIISIGTNPFLSVIAMVILAFVISICSNVDAFFVLAYAQTFTSGAILSFLVFGPMIDIKILSMLRTTFKGKFLFELTLLITLLALLAGLIYNFVA